MLAPFVNPYEVSMTKEEMSRTWENWTRRRKLLYYLARRFPKFLSYFYSRTFLSGKHGQIDKWLSLSLAKKVGSGPHIHYNFLCKLYKRKLKLKPVRQHLVAA